MATKKTTTPKTTKAVSVLAPLAHELVEQSHLHEAAALALLAEFGDPLKEARRLVSEYNAGPVLIVTDEKDKAGMKKAAELRKQFKAARLAVSKQHTEVKAEALNRSKAVDLVKRLTLAELEPIEAHLTEQEKYAEVKALERLAETVAERQKELAPYVEDVTIFDLGAMSDHAWETLLESSKLAHRARIDAEKAEIEKAAAEAKKAEEERRKALEAEQAARAKAEAELAEERAKQAERDAIVAKERAEQQAKLDAERAEREKLEAEKRRLDKEAAERLQAEQQAAIDKAEAEQKAASAPDKDKLLQYVAAIEDLLAPRPATPKGQTTLHRIETHLAQNIKMYRDLIEKEL